MAGPSCTTPGDDHGNCPETATLLTENQVLNGFFITGNIELPGDVDYFSFDVGAEHIEYLFVIETTVPPSDPFSDTFIRLLDTDGFTQIVSDDNSGEGSGSQILWSPESPGVYYVEVSQFFTEDTGLYSVSVFRAGPAPPDDHGDDPSTATFLIADGTPVSGSIELSADVDFFQFIALPGQFYDIETSNLDDGSDTVISLLDNDAETVLGTDDQSGREFNASRILWVSPPDAAPPNDLYFVGVSQFLPSKTGVGYALSVTGSGSPEVLPTDGIPKVGDLLQPGDVDAYVFSATKSHTTRMNLATTNEINNFELRLLDSDGISLLQEQSNLEFEDLVHQHENTGDFFLTVTEPFQGGAYALSATDEVEAGNPDLNGDGRIDAIDFILLMEAYRTGEEP
jgi:hypothetical protein